MKKNYIITSLVLLLLNLSCNGNNQLVRSIRGFDLSSDDNRILFSLNENGNTTIYAMDLETNNLNLLIKSAADKFHVNPKYSSDGEKIIFIEYDKKNLESSILCIANSDGSNIQYLTNGGGIVTEAIFSENGNEVIFAEAKEYDSYSPIGIKDAHGYDLFSINLLTKKITQISNINAYALHHLFEVDKSTLLLFIYKGEDGGMFLFNKNSPDDMKRIVPVNNPRGDASMYDTPIYSKQYNSLAFIAPYQIYIMDMDIKNAELLYDNRGKGHIDYISFFNKSKKLMFVKKGEDSFYSINLDGSEVKRIPLDLK